MNLGRLVLWMVLLLGAKAACSSIYTDPLSKDGGKDGDNPPPGCASLTTCATCVEKIGCGFCTQTGDCRRLDDRTGCGTMIDITYSSDCHNYECTLRKDEGGCADAGCLWCPVGSGLCVENESDCVDAAINLCIDQFLALDGCGNCVYAECQNELWECCHDNNCDTVFSQIRTCSRSDANCSDCQDLYWDLNGGPFSNEDDMIYCIANKYRTEYTDDCLWDCVNSHCQ